MVNKSSNSTFAGGINDILFIYPKEIACTLILQFASRLIIPFSFISNTEPNYLTNILNNLPKGKFCKRKEEKSEREEKL